MLAILAITAYVLRPGGYFRPVTIARDPFYSLEPLDQPERLKWLIRVPGVEVGQPFWDQEFKVVIDVNGHPVSVSHLPSHPNIPALNAPTAIIDAAVAQIRAWRFTSVRKDGTPVYASFTGLYTLAPGQDRPANHVPFPETMDLQSVVITYEEQGIQRPGRVITIHGNGDADFQAAVGPGNGAPSHTTLPKAVILGLLDRFRRADFFSLKGYYGGGPTDATLRTVSITAGGQTKKISDYVGECGGLPDSVMEIEDAIQRESGFKLPGEFTP